MRKILLILMILVLPFSYAVAIQNMKHIEKITFISKQNIKPKCIKLRNMEDRASAINVV
ncbi:hypothetical protein [Francisella sp. SYW-9]|uniref:hypothetical protein n=1 Tax=Francisella sp. SYW-9 TaxID=2610888 RepID=UPI00168CAE7E|nr:hypothetical protein [Francisella sp. SYW-9]